MVRFASHNNKAIARYLATKSSNRACCLVYLGKDEYPWEFGLAISFVDCCRHKPMQPHGQFLVWDNNIFMKFGNEHDQIEEQGSGFKSQFDFEGSKVSFFLLQGKNVEGRG
jgi:hypothetical protein